MLKILDSWDGYCYCALPFPLHLSLPEQSETGIPETVKQTNREIEKRQNTHATVLFVRCCLDPSASSVNNIVTDL
jgi:hypothetical protein